MDARDRYTGANDPVYNTNNNLIAVSQNDLFYGSLLASNNFDDYGNAGQGAGSVYFWSQSSTAWSYIGSNYGQNYYDWTNGSSNTSVAGYNGKTDISWIYGYAYMQCTSTARLHCISQ